MADRRSALNFLAQKVRVSDGKLSTAMCRIAAFEQHVVELQQQRVQLQQVGLVDLEVGTQVRAKAPTPSTMAPCSPLGFDDFEIVSDSGGDGTICEKRN